jgi:hypothetical protein
MDNAGARVADSRTPAGFGQYQTDIETDRHFLTVLIHVAETSTG